MDSKDVAWLVDISTFFLTLVYEDECFMHSRLGQGRRVVIIIM